MKQRVLSGIRATGRLHLGNYLGAVNGMLALQEDPSYETLYMVADVHAVTTPYDVDALRKNRREVIIDYLAAGLDPQKSVLFLQSMVPEHLELAFYLSSVVTVAKMQHLPTFKDKVKQYPEAATMALLNYPVLMTADILVYKAGLVPVGIDQEPHLEVAREIARRMNQDYSTDFPEPQRFKTEGEYVPSLTGEGKMSKSVEGSYINLTDSLEEIKAKLAKVPTDSGVGEVSGLGNIDINIHVGRSDVSGYQYKDGKTGQVSQGLVSLMKLVALFMPEKLPSYNEAYTSTGLRYGEVKNDLAQAIFDELKPIQEKRKALEADTAYVDQVIKEGAEKARIIAQATVDEVKQKMGLA